MMKIIKKEDMNAILGKLWDGFIEAHFKRNHFENVRSKFRVALLSHLTDMGMTEKLKLVDIDKKIYSHISYFEDYPYYSLNPEATGSYGQISTNPFKCIDNRLRMRRDGERANNPMSIVKKRAI